MKSIILAANPPFQDKISKLEAWHFYDPQENVEYFLRSSTSSCAMYQKNIRILQEA
jgi:hypothetical protein